LVTIDTTPHHTTPHVYGKEMLVIAFDSSKWIITIQLTGVSGIVDSIAGKMSRYTSLVPKSATVANRTHYISDSELALELSPEVPTSAPKVWQILHTEGMYLYHIQRIQYLEPADMCSRLELCPWINSNPHPVRFVKFFSTDETHTR
jgi:hypothetical protein